MKKSLRMRLAAVTVLPVLLLAVSACEERVISTPSFPPSADLESVTAPKPRPNPEIVTDPQAAERYNSSVEGWGDGVLDAGRRICAWAEEMGAELPFECYREAPD